LFCSVANGLGVERDATHEKRQALIGFDGFNPGMPAGPANMACLRMGGKTIVTLKCS
jgi:hypothetical protein